MSHIQESCECAKEILPRKNLQLALAGHLQLEAGDLQQGLRLPIDSNKCQLLGEVG